MVLLFFFHEEEDGIGPNLQADAVFSQTADSIGHDVGNLSADGVVAAGVVVGRVLLARDQLVGMEQLAVGSSTDHVCSTGNEVETNETLLQFNANVSFVCFFFLFWFSCFLK